MTIIHSIIQALFDIDPYLGALLIWVFFMGIAYLVLTVAEHISWWVFGY